MAMYAIIAATALVAGIVQGVTGFGAGIVLVLALPHFFALPQCAGMAGAISIALCAMMVWQYRAELSMRKALVPTVLYMAVCTIAINFSTMVDQALLKRVFGVFLVLLSAYYLFLNKSDGSKELSLPVKLVCIAVSGACDGLFGIGGPLMVLYFMASTSSTREYLGTLQLFFLVNCVYNTVFRVWRGILVTEHLPVIVIGAAGILAGVWLAAKVVDRLDPNLVRKLTYVMIGVSGVANLL